MTNSFAEKFTYFKFKECNYSQEKRLLEFSYSLEDKIELKETLEISSSSDIFDCPDKILSRGLHLAHLALGVSYIKTIGFKPLKAELSPNEASFFEKLFIRGLGEYSYLNKLSNFEDLKFLSASGNSNYAKLPEHCNKTIIPLGGGKDSLLTVELLKKKINNLFLFALVRPGQEKFYEQIAETAELPLITVTRRLDSKLADLNKLGAYNGHVPFSSILAFSILALAPLLGIKEAILSNEHSANFANLHWSGLEINHQYSKSIEFENDFRHFNTENGLNGFNYFSFLRSLSEINIIKKFSEFHKYDSIFTSCNRFFALGDKLWCGKCAKCCFFFILASTYFGKDRLLRIFGFNLLDDSDLFTLFDEICGFSGIKPFDCVGVPEEAQLALLLCSNDAEWQNSNYLNARKNRILEIKEKENYYKELAFSVSATHNIPDNYLRLINENFNCCQ